MTVQAPLTLFLLLSLLGGGLVDEVHRLPHRMTKRAAKIGGSALLREVKAVREKEEGRDGRRARGLLEMFYSLSDIRTGGDDLVRGGNSTGFEDRGILDFVAEVATNLLGGASDKNEGPVLIPNHCW